jgi:hypothetical protein
MLPMRLRARTLLVILLPAAIVVLIAGGIAALRQFDEEPPPQATPTPGITVTAGEIRALPDVSGTRRRVATEELESALERFYREAFIAPESSKDAPAPGPLQRIRTLMTSAAREAAKKRPEIFESTADLSVTSGNAVFSGLVTMDGAKPLHALLDVDFNALATPIGYDTPVAKIRHVGTLRMKRTKTGWLVDGFDLRMRTQPLPSPSPGS